MMHACVLSALSALDDRYDTKVRRGDTETRRGEHLENFHGGVEDSTREVGFADARAFCCPQTSFHYRSRNLRRNTYMQYPSKNESWSLFDLPFLTHVRNILYAIWLKPHLSAYSDG
ncbi:unnamed protein product [Ectocarpus fasciculatus]